MSCVSLIACNLCNYTSLAVHPEMQFLQNEMTKRRDKMLDLASRKRSYGVIIATKRRKADEEGVWCWWKVTFFSINLGDLLIAYTPYSR